jgi:hypothetical protein
MAEGGDALIGFYASSAFCAPLFNCFNTAKGEDGSGAFSVLWRRGFLP